MSTSSPSRRLTTGLLFIGPNIVGFAAFTLIPMVLSIAMAFTDWSLLKHNPYKREELQFVGIANFIRLFSQPEFLRFLGNTLFLMMGIPLGIGLSLVSAILLSRDLTGGSRRTFAVLLCGAVLVGSCIILTMIGAGASAMTLLLAGLFALMLLGGVAGGSTVYRTLFYIPSFTSGVAIYILWKRIYNSQTGPLNAALTPVLDGLAGVVRQTPWPLFNVMAWICLSLMLLILLSGLWRLRLAWRDGEIGHVTAILSVATLLLPVVMSSQWHFTSDLAMPLIAGAAAILAWQIFVASHHGVDFRATLLAGMGSTLLLVASAAALEFVMLGLAPVLGNLPSMAADGLSPPAWLTDYHWAKPALMIMGLWSAIGSQNMLLYIAALSNVPQELYEAADIDGASRLARFWHVTWPQLAPTTFFIVVMSVIGGLQGGFEIARTMTQGGPAGATTALSYFIYIEGFETGRLGYSSAVAWSLFAMVLVVTIFNLRVGGRYVNE